MDLKAKKCIPCEAGTPPLTTQNIEIYQKEISSNWTLIDAKKIQREHSFKDFKEAMSFINKVADIAESEGHHPDIFVSYNKVRITLWTHAIGGLSQNDFILATKIDAIT